MYWQGGGLCKPVADPDHAAPCKDQEVSIRCAENSDQDTEDTAILKHLSRLPFWQGWPSEAGRVALCHPGLG